MNTLYLILYNIKYNVSLLSKLNLSDKINLDLFFIGYSFKTTNLINALVSMLLLGINLFSDF
jgi:hypothetical protein